MKLWLVELTSVPRCHLFFFFYWRYNPLLVLAFSVILLHSVLSLLSFLHPLIPNAWMFSSVPLTHLYLGPPQMSLQSEYFSILADCLYTEFA